jgi:hypothetical protein
MRLSISEMSAGHNAAPADFRAVNPSNVKHCSEIPVLKRQALSVPQLMKTAVLSA